MTILLQSEKKAVLKSCRKLLDLGLVSELSGNVSVRSEVDGRKKLIVITPTGHRYSELSEDDIAVVDFNLEPVEGNLIPSSESLMHIEIYRINWASIVLVKSSAYCYFGGPIFLLCYQWPNQGIGVDLCQQVELL